MDKLDSVWNYPWDETHANDQDINLLVLSQQPENKEQFEAMVNNRWAMRQNWIAILEELGIPLQDPPPRFEGYKHPKSIKLSHWIRANKAACRRLIHNPEVRDLEYRFFPMVYLDKIIESGKENQFRQLASK
jgi:hypothetical protein